MEASNLVPDKILFQVISTSKAIAPGPWRAFLIEDNWDDWAKFRTQFQLYFFDGSSVRYELGDVKIGQFGLKPAPRSAQVQSGRRQPAVPQSFSQLDESFFSLGQGENYYEQLGQLEQPIRDLLATGLRDVVHDRDLWLRALDEEVMGESLLRSVLRKNVEQQFARLLAGGARLSGYAFHYDYPKRVAADGPKPKLTFKVRPESLPPTNIHVLIGRNGVGKTYTLNLMTKSLAGEQSAASQSGQFVSDSGASSNPFFAKDDDDIPFANLVSVSFSAFDEFHAVPENRDHAKGIRNSYIGLRRPGSADNDSQGPKSPQMLATEFVKSVRMCVTGPRALRWRHALKTLEVDSIFKDSDISSLAIEQVARASDWEINAKRLFSKLSSGHKIVLLSITRMVETVDEKTLVLLDEPEAHLHPPLLSSFVRALSDLLVNRNGVAIIATHSPVVLQEVPKECVWILQRTGSEAAFHRPEVETFGENVGVLTREVFGLEVVQSGFHKMLTDVRDTTSSFEKAVDVFEQKLGGEARAILRGLFLSKKT